MSAAPCSKPLRHALRAALLALAVTGAAAGSAWAQSAAPEDDDLEDHLLNADKKLMNAILAPLGLAPSAEPDIQYRERSPLVIPQGNKLPPPGKSAKGPDWPVEPEVKAKRAAAALQKSGRSPNIVDPAKPISGTPEYWRTGNTGTWAADPKPRQEPDFFTMLMKGQLGGSWEEYGKFEGEAPRNSLTQPPEGYLTPSPAAPYGVTPHADQPQKKEPKY
jgi:hypothetical protein